MATRRESPYIWVTWLSKLLVGDNSCEWSSWFKAQHEGRSWKKVVRAQDSFDLSQWMLDHTDAVNRCRQEWVSRNYKTFTEGQNAFQLQGRSATLGGKPDLIAIGDSNVILDVKTGSPSNAHIAQVMIYMYAVPIAIKHFRKTIFEGKVVYNDHEVEVPNGRVDQEFVSSLTELVQRLASPSPAIKVPSYSECRYCEISSEDCPERVEENPAHGYTEDF